MKISLIMLTFNRLVLTKQCLKNLFDNTPEEFELIIVDDHSTDGTVDYLSEHKDEIDKLILNGTQKGIAANINTGITMATGDLIIDYLPNDAIVPKGWLTDLLERQKSLPPHSIPSPFIWVFDVLQPDWEYFRAISNPNLTEEDYERVKTPHIRHHAVFNNLLPIPRDVYNKIGGHRIFDSALHGPDDADLSDRLNRAGFTTYILTDLKTVNCSRVDSLMYTDYQKWKDKESNKSILSYYNTTLTETLTGGVYDEAVAKVVANASMLGALHDEVLTKELKAKYPETLCQPHEWESDYTKNGWRCAKCGQRKSAASADEDAL